MDRPLAAAALAYPASPSGVDVDSLDSTHAWTRVAGYETRSGTLSR